MQRLVCASCLHLEKLSCNIMTGTVKAVPPFSICTVPILPLLIVLSHGQKRIILKIVFCSLSRLNLSCADPYLSLTERPALWCTAGLTSVTAVCAADCSAPAHCKNHTSTSLTLAVSRLIQQSPRTGCYQARNVRKIYSARRFGCDLKNRDWYLETGSRCT